MQLIGEKLVTMTAVAILLATAAASQESETGAGAATDTTTEAPLAEPGTAETDAAPVEALEDATAAETDAEPDMGLGEGAGDPAAPEVLEVVRDTFGDWQVRCSPDNTDCFMYQLALDTDDNPVAELSMIRLEPGNEAAAGATVVTPLGTLLPAGLVMQVDSGEQRQYPFSWCSQVGCFSRFGLAQTTVDAMRRGAVAKLSIASVAAADQTITLDISLSGFTDAYNSLEPTEPPE